MNVLVIAILIVAALGNSASLTKAAQTKERQKSSQKPVASTTYIDPIEHEYEKLLELDDAAQEEVDKWIRDAKAFEVKGSSLPEAMLNSKIEQRFGEVKKSYETFLQLHPKHAKARLAYGSFLNDIQEDGAAVTHWEKARELDPSNPAAWNNLANHYGHRGPIKKSFEYYDKAIELNPKEPVYLQNLATTVYLFRDDAMGHYHITEDQVFAKALDLYRQALKLDPKNFPLATDLAQSYYGIKPLRTKEALEAWEYAVKVANDNIEREGVYLHMARVELNSGMFIAARQHINIVTNQMYDVLKGRLIRNLAEKEAKAKKGDSAGAANTLGTLSSGASKPSASAIGTSREPAK
ncbi:MAG: hypothetical protein EXS31_00630 [Pedosphaera sp.]|nr:hypothetical protein [Pedosphaera sp.]